MGSLLRKWRESKRLTQAYIASRLDLDRATICNYEHDKRRITCDQLRDICRVMEITPSEFFMGPQANRSTTRYVVEEMLGILDDDQLSRVIGYIDHMLEGGDISDKTSATQPGYG